MIESKWTAPVVVAVLLASGYGIRWAVEVGGFGGGFVLGLVFGFGGAVGIGVWRLNRPGATKTARARRARGGG